MASGYFSSNQVKQTSCQLKNGNSATKSSMRIHPTKRHPKGYIFLCHKSTCGLSQKPHLCSFGRLVKPLHSFPFLLQIDINGIHSIIKVRCTIVKQSRPRRTVIVFPFVLYTCWSISFAMYADILYHMRAHLLNLLFYLTTLISEIMNIYEIHLHLSQVYYEPI